MGILGWEVRVLQLGDGDILVASATGPAARPIPRQPGRVGEETESLCMPNAAALFRSARTALAPDEPALVIIATDGYANSFASDEGFVQVGADLRAMILDHGLDWVGHRLPEWLEEATTEGSGDDITVMVAWSEAPYETAPGRVGS